MFHLTSNVDHHHARCFEAEELHACHGSIELWQCGEPCSPRVWRAPPGFRFDVDPKVIRKGG